MENTTIFPHIKVFVDTDNEVHLLTYASEKNNGHKQDSHIGLELIDFITLDLTEFEREIKKASAETTLAYDYMRNLIFDLADYFKGKYDMAHFFLIGRLNKIFAEETFADKQFELCFNELFSILELHKVFSFGVHLCLDIENLPQYTMPEKFVGFVTQYEKYNDFALKTSVKITPTYKDKLYFEIVKSINKKEITDTRALLQAIHRDENGVSAASFTLIETFEEMLYFEFVELLKQGLQVKRCKLCGKYFVLLNKHNADFCDRIYTGTRTCKQVGAKKAYNERNKKDPFLQEWDKIYKRYYARFSASENGMPFEKYPDSKFYNISFEQWSKIASDLKKKYLSGEIDGEGLVRGVGDEL